MREDVQLVRDAVLTERRRVEIAVDDVDAFVVRGVPEEGGRRRIGDVEIVREFLIVRAVPEKVHEGADVRDARFVRHVADGVAEDRRVRDRILPVDLVEALKIDGIRISRDKPGEMTARGRAHHRDLVRIEAVFRGVMPDPADCPARIEEFEREAMRQDAVFAHERVHTDGIEVFRVTLPFVRRAHAVSAAGVDDDGRVRDAVLCREVFENRFFFAHAGGLVPEFDGSHGKILSEMMLMDQPQISRSQPSRSPPHCPTEGLPAARPRP